MEIVGVALVSFVYGVLAGAILEAVINGGRRG